MDQREMIEHLKQNPQIVQAMMNSSDGQALMQILRGADGGQALDRASAGNTAQMVQLLKGVLSAPGGAELLRRIGASLQK